MRFRELGGEVVAVSCVTNKAAGLGTGPLDHSHITQVAKQPVALLSELIRGALSL
jgi:purine nucleoside phosphorylase